VCSLKGHVSEDLHAADLAAVQPGATTNSVSGRFASGLDDPPNPAVAIGAVQLTPPSCGSCCCLWELAVETLASVKAGRHEADAVEAVFGATGHRVSRRGEGPADLAPREAWSSAWSRGDSPNKEIAEWLVISPKTVANHPRRRSS
jgi:hypothetical protein